MKNEVNQSSYFFLAVIILSSAIIATGPLQDPDLWWHIKTGEIILAEKSFPTRDIFTFTATGNTWRAYSWLPEIIFYLTSRLGFFALIVLRILILTTISVVLYLFIDRVIKNPQFSALAVFLGWGSCYPVWELRPHIFSFLFLALLSGIFVLRLKKIKDLTKFLPLIFLLWANSHIYFVIGLLLLFAFFVLDWLFINKRMDIQLLLILLVSFAVTLINPYSVEIYKQFIQLARHSWTWDWVMEMAKPWPTDLRVFAFWTYVVFTAVLIFCLKKFLTITSGFFLLLSFLLSLTALRHIAFFPVVSLPFIAVVLSKIYLPETRRVSNSATLILFLTLTTLLLWRLANDYKKPISETVPVKAASFVKEKKLPGPIANYFDFGGYFIFSLWPEYKIFMDGRTQVFSNSFLEECATLLSHDVNIKKAKAIFKKYKVKTIIWQTAHPLSEALLKEGFHAIYRDKTAIVFEMKKK